MGKSNTELAERAIAGDSTAYEALIHLHFDAVYAVALAVTGVHEDAEDAAQEGMVKAWQRIGQCRHPERFRSWLLTIVRTVSLDLIAHRSRRTIVSISDALRDNAPGPDRSADRSELRDRLSDALGHLTPHQRHVLLLFDLEGFRHREIAEILKISETMSRRYLSDARARMRDLLRPYAFQGRVSHG